MSRPNRPVLTWQATDVSTVFRVKAENGIALSLGDWARLPLTAEDGASVHIGTLLRLSEAGSAEWNETDKSLHVAPVVIASLSESERRAIGLPRDLPYSLEVESDGIPSDPTFSIRYRFLDPTSNRSIVAPRRIGSILEVGDKMYSVPEPFYGLLTAADSMNSREAIDRVGQLEAVAAFQASLPPDVQLGEHFRSIRLARAEAVSLRPFLNQAGEPDFEPRLLHRGSATADESGEGSGARALLPDAVQKSWSEYFRRRREYVGVTPAGDGWIVLTPDSLTKVLSTLKRVQGGSLGARRLLIANPQATLKEALSGVISESLLEDLILETDDYSSRVREIGIWQPRVLPFLRSIGQEWLPPEEFGLRVGDEPITIPREALGTVIAQIEEAIQQQGPHVEFEGRRIPATPAALEALRELERASSRPLAESREGAATSRVSLLILDNLESLEFERERRPTATEAPKAAEFLNSTLLPHQVDGVEWLQNLWKQGRSGGLLADDMGLGKTFQALAFLAWLQRARSPGDGAHLPILVVGPTGLLRNWVAEHGIHLQDPGLGEGLEVHGAGLKALRLQGAKSGSETTGGLPVLDVDRLRGADWVLTTYETLRDYQHSFGRVRWLAIVLDEVQKIKNPQALVTDAVKAMNADFWIALTGTPVENRLADLWCITDAIQPGLLGALKEFSRLYETPDAELPGRLESLRAQLLETRTPAMVRRMKVDHLEGLPKLAIHQERYQMPEAQSKAYSEAVVRARAASSQAGILKALQELRIISLHPHRAISGRDDDFIAASARWNRAFQILEQIRRAKEKALIFLDSLVHQGVLAEILQRRFELPGPPLIISGEVPGPKRKDRVDEFQARHGFDVMILSPRAGGVGLTLTAANHVIHLSRWWNPAVEDQCTDRVYRIGQQREVHVHLPIAVHPEYGDHSFDLRLNELLERKRRLSQRVLSPIATSETELRDLFGEVTT